MMGSPLGPGGRERRRWFCCRPRQTQYAAKRAASQTKADIPESSHGSKARTPKIIVGWERVGEGTPGDGGGE